MLLGAAKALKEIEDKLTCRVILLFQPSEEGLQSGAEVMVENGIMDEIDIIAGMHVEGTMDAGKMGVCRGASQASSRNIKIEFFGNTAHATLPHSGNDALAASVNTYTNIQTTLARKVNPLAEYVYSIGKMQGGTSQNVVADYAQMLGTVRTFDMDVDQLIIDTIEEVAEHTAKNYRRGKYCSNAKENGSRGFFQISAKEARCIYAYRNTKCRKRNYDFSS